jgi:hypothetical protein
MGDAWNSPALTQAKRTLAIALLSIVMAAGGTPASARERIASLPEGVQPSGQKKVRGLYAEVEFGRNDVNQELEALEEECKAGGVEARIEGRDLAWKGKKRLYRTRTSVAVFEDTPTITADRKACSAVITLTRTATVRTGPWPSIKTADWADPPPACARHARCWASKPAGIEARCIDLGDGLNGSTLCYSVQDDLSRDLVVARTYYRDDAAESNTVWAFDLVLTDVPIDPAVFAGAAAGAPR